MSALLRTIPRPATHHPPLPGLVRSKTPLGVERVLATIKFRISGQAKKFFGDGIALWFVTEPSYPRFAAKKDGEEMHGGNEKFEGIAVIFDTFRNTEALEQHRDVTVLFNDGTKTRELMDVELEGCDANLRFHEERGDFSVMDAARAKVIIDTIDDPGAEPGDEEREPISRLTVAMDPKASGEWADPPCVSMRLPFSPGWVAHAHVGVTATTGQARSRTRAEISLSFPVFVFLRFLRSSRPLTPVPFPSPSRVARGVRAGLTGRCAATQRTPCVCARDDRPPAVARPARRQP